MKRIQYSWVRKLLACNFLWCFTSNGPPSVSAKGSFNNITEQCSHFISFKLRFITLFTTLLIDVCSSNMS
jgi:hypothetical protein